MLRGLSGEGAALRARGAFDAADARASWATLLARDALDWCLVAALVILAIGCDAAEPFQQYLQPEQLWALSYPLQPNTVPSWSVLPLGFLLPAAVLAALRLERRETARVACVIWALRVDVAVAQWR
jgi:hypothetical protein